ncbi:hypothetical protein [Chitinophaga sp. MM2321]|uniref:hypothetical protein n=1 Tax=Chitinophaga sp. MM2321 TaxID=3137178 RepID=UPI0032D56CB2
MSVDINISNYESFLLSYIDSELNGEEVAALELFLQKHPQIRQELELLEGTRMVPDEKIVFDNKAALYQLEAPADNSYELLLLDYVDGELSDEDAQRLLGWLQQHPEAQKELALLQAAKLQPDHNLVFEHKTTLYRSNQRKPARIYPGIWWCAAAAAMLAGVIVWMPSSAPDHPPVVAGTVNRTVATPPAAPASVAVLPEMGQPAVAKNTVSAEKKTVNTPVKKIAAPVQTVKVQQAPAVATVVQPARTDAPVISQLPSPRNTSDEVVEKHLQQTETIVATNTINNSNVNTGTGNEALLAASTNIKTAVSKPAAAPEQATVKGELIMSVSGSDSKILDKVTNVAKFFSRKRNK